MDEKCLELLYSDERAPYELSFLPRHVLYKVTLNTIEEEILLKKRLTTQSRAGLLLKGCMAIEGAGSRFMSSVE